MKQTLQFFLQMYKRWVSPALPHSCRFVPTCSEYAMEAIELHGAVRGSWLAAGRLLRCHPFARAGFDPPPGQSQVSECLGTHVR
jgi:putative membrane protein insertion efficiency factor